MKNMGSSLKMFVWLTLLTGIIYPLIITGIAQLTMKKKANGDFILLKEKIIGANLIAQKFENPQYFWPRPSATDYNPLASGGSNLSPTNEKLKKIVDERRQTIMKMQNLNGQASIPAELLFSSGSGLDPHISLETARFQLDRIIHARKWDEKIKIDLDNLLFKLSEKDFFGFLSEPYVNVLKLNLALEDISEMQSNIGRVVN
jgi:K+-transporting ATPase ATPase C chain